MGKSGFWKEIRRHANLVPTLSFRLCSLFAWLQPSVPPHRWVSPQAQHQQDQRPWTEDYETMSYGSLSS